MPTTVVGFRLGNGMYQMTAIVTQTGRLHLASGAYGLPGHTSKPRMPIGEHPVHVRVGDLRGPVGEVPGPWVRGGPRPAGLCASGGHRGSAGRTGGNDPAPAWTPRAAELLRLLRRGAQVSGPPRGVIGYSVTANGVRLRAGQAGVVLERDEVSELHAALTAWLLLNPPASGATSEEAEDVRGGRTTPP